MTARTLLSESDLSSGMLGLVTLVVVGYGAIVLGVWALVTTDRPARRTRRWFL